jgi:hypothetical protein
MEKVKTLYLYVITLIWAIQFWFAEKNVTNEKPSK